MLHVQNIWAWLISNPDEASAAATGLLGAFLLARRGQGAPWGWIGFLASNFGLLSFAWRNGHPGLFVLQCGFTVTSVLGIWTYLLRPRLQWTEWRGDFEGNATMEIMPLVRWRGRRIDLHRMIGCDGAGCFHTHPARAIRIVLWGGYCEEINAGPNDAARGLPWLQHWRPGMVGLVRPQLAHRIAGLPRGVSYSLWLRGRKTHKTLLVGDGWPEGAEAA